MSSELNGLTGYIGRYYPKTGRPKDFFTLHQLAGKVIYNQYGWGDFKGLQMHQFIEVALKNVFGQQPSRESIIFYCDLIRLHKTKTISAEEFPNGKEVLKHYEDLLDSNYDFEDILQHASWLLKNMMVTSLNRFRFKNVILLDPDTLNQPNNRNALDFFNCFSEWATSKGVNIYIQKRDFQLDLNTFKEARGIQ
ncbi:hypothetical protein [Guptibacillus sedimenti]|uniref:hypothetical protein n=1 Tax=Guptibacillus sedimenti TaxID=3025680 RepID=UPI002362D814|nr:hypothetical protein [Pseudalkalibacillus sedimenti]